MNINRKISKYNFNKGSVSRIKYIVIHYVGALGGAEDNCRYYGGGNRNASAHYFVGFNGEVWQCVEDANIAWHCGASSYKHAECRNANSIGIEMCVRKKNTKSMGATDKDWYFEDATVEAAAELNMQLGFLWEELQGYTAVMDALKKAGSVRAASDAVLTGYEKPADQSETVKKKRAEYGEGYYKKYAAGNGTKYYRVRKSWTDAASQLGAFTSLENAKSACKAGYTVYDDNGKAVYTAAGQQASAGVPFSVQVDILDLNIRTGAGTNYAKTGETTGKGVFTIVEVKAGQGASVGWGRLKSGAGWISLDYATRLA